MSRELSWPESGATEAAYQGDGLHDAPSPVSLPRALALEQLDEDRRISAAAAFVIFMFGCGCGAFWTIFLTWIF